MPTVIPGKAEFPVSPSRSEATGTEHKDRQLSAHLDGQLQIHATPDTGRHLVGRDLQKPATRISGTQEETQNGGRRQRIRSNEIKIQAFKAGSHLGTMCGPRQAWCLPTLVKGDLRSLV